MDRTRDRMRELNAVARQARLEKSRPQIDSRRLYIENMLPKIKQAKADALEICPKVKAVVSEVEALPWGPGCVRSTELQKATEEVKSLLNFGGQSLVQQCEELLAMKFTDEQLADQFSSDFFRFKQLGECVIAAPGALRQLKTVIEWERSQLEDRLPARNVTAPALQPSPKGERLEVFSNIIEE